MTNDHVQIVPPMGSDVVFRVPRPDGQRGVPLWISPGSLPGPATAAAEAWQRGRWDGLRKVSGPWAMAVADGADIVVARDPLGVMPLYWTHQHEEILVSHHLASLLEACQPVPPLDPQGLAVRFAPGAHGLPMQRATDFVGVYALPFGHALTIDTSGGVQERRFWDPRTISAKSSPEWSLHECVDQLERALDAAFRRQAEALGSAKVAMALTGDGTLQRRLAQRIERAGGEVAVGFPGDRAAGGVARWTDWPLGSSRPTAQSRERSNRLDYHRYGTRSVRSWCVRLPAAVEAGATVFVSSEMAGHVNFDGRGVLNQALAHWRWRLAWEAAATESGRRGAAIRTTLADILRQHALGRSARTLTRRRSRPGVPSGPRWRSIRGASAFLTALIEAGESWRRLESLNAIAWELGMHVTAPFMDVELVTCLLRMPDRAWVANGQPGWVGWQVLQRWGSQPTGDSAPALEPDPPGLPPPSLLENDPEMIKTWADISPGRRLGAGVPLRPRQWLQP